MIKGIVFTAFCCSGLLIALAMWTPYFLPRKTMIFGSGEREREEQILDSSAWQSKLTMKLGMYRAALLLFTTFPTLHFVCKEEKQ